ncbi:MAG: LysM peptidoglycan-binding domain-containing protein [Clostridiaceae bacterium]|nr:LysM peptidoglycan-binding domain-containing protein [Clostridiaceae bacterium]
MKVKLKRKLKNFLNRKKFLNEDIYHDYSGHTHTSSNIRVLESLLRQKHMEMEQPQPRKLSDIINSEDYPSNYEISWGAISIGVIGIMLILMVWLIISYVQINRKYERLAQSISQKNTVASSNATDQDKNIDDLEDKLAQIEKKVNTYIEQSKSTTTAQEPGKVGTEEYKNSETPENIKTSQSSGNTVNIKQTQNVQNTDNAKQSQNLQNSASTEEPKSSQKTESTKESENETSNTLSSTADKLSEDGKYIIYTIQKGDTLWKISNRYFGSGKRVSELMQINGLEDTNNLEVGKTILIPVE